MKKLRSSIMILMIVFVAACIAAPKIAAADSYKKIDRESRQALKSLLDSSDKARELAKSAKAVLVFPGMAKAGLIIGGQYGEGALIREGKTIGYYNSVSVSYGLQAGAQKFGYALFLMTEDAISYLDRSDGWELGTGPTIVVMDKGAATGLSTTTGKSDVYAFFFDQKGLMAGIGLQGTKISKK